MVSRGHLACPNRDHSYIESCSDGGCGCGENSGFNHLDGEHDNDPEDIPHREE